MKNEKIILIGAGNVGYHLGRRLHEKDFAIAQVFSRTIEHARDLAKAVQAPYVTKFEDVDRNGDLYIISVSDSAIAPVARQLARLELDKPLVVHTSGATPATALMPYFDRFGVFYPLQTFSRARKVDFEPIPICVHAADETDTEQLLGLARQLSSKVYELNDEQRATIHVAAVFVNNFANYLFQVGEDILRKADLPFDLLRPLILETAQKVQEESPAEMQTGPAVRGDEETIKRHLDYLHRFPEYRELYRLLSRRIAEEFN